MNKKRDLFEPLPIPFIRASWMRCEAKGLSPDAVSLSRIAPVQKSDESLTNQQSTPVNLSSVLRLIKMCSDGSWCITGICDSNAVCLELLYTDSAKACTDKLNLHKGVMIDESSAGTCAPSLSVLLRHPCTIIGESHYLKLFRSFHTMAVPIFDQSVQNFYCLFVFTKYQGVMIENSFLAYSFAKRILSKIWESPQVIDTISRLYDKMHVLTNREKQVFSFLLVGCKSSEIQEILNINKFTVRDHCQSIYKKLEVKDKTEILNLIQS